MIRLLISLTVLCLISCNTQNNISTKTDDIIFTIRKTGCKGICPIYYMAIYESGKVVYEGDKNVLKIGSYKKTIDSKQLKHLIKKFNKANYFHFEDEYTSPKTDLPTTYTSFNKKGNTKKIRNYSGAPKKLNELEILLNNIAHNELGWMKIENP